MKRDSQKPTTIAAQMLCRFALHMSPVSKCNGNLRRAVYIDVSVEQHIISRHSLLQSS